MRNRTVRLVAAVLLSAGVAGCAATTEDQRGEVVECAVCGLLADDGVASVHSHGDTTYHFCGPDCKAWFMGSPDLVTSGIILDVICGRLVHREDCVTALEGGRRVYFCSERCRERYLIDPGRYAIGVDFVAKEIRPLSDMPFEVRFEGRTYRFHAEASRDEFIADPSAFIHEECPVCGAVFVRADAAAVKRHGGGMRYFCSRSCLERFEEDPARYGRPADSGIRDGEGPGGGDP